MNILCEKCIHIIIITRRHTYKTIIFEECSFFWVFVFWTHYELCMYIIHVLVYVYILIHQNEMISRRKLEISIVWFHCHKMIWKVPGISFFKYRMFGCCFQCFYNGKTYGAVLTLPLFIRYFKIRDSMVRQHGTSDFYYYYCDSEMKWWKKRTPGAFLLFAFFHLMRKLSSRINNIPFVGLSNALHIHICWGTWGEFFWKILIVDHLCVRVGVFKYLFFFYFLLHHE